MSLKFEWDPEKAKSNVSKHGVTFEEASTVFKDTLSICIPDPLHSVGEEGFILIGMSINGKVLIVSHSDRGESVRIISARQANKKEKSNYENHEE